MKVPEDYNGVERIGRGHAVLKVMLCIRDFNKLAQMAANTNRDPVGMASWLVRVGLGVAPQGESDAQGGGE
jgi:hypothetical protein